MITYISVETWKRKTSYRFFLSYLFWLFFIVLMSLFVFSYLKSKEIWITKKLQVNHLESGNYQLYVDNQDLTRLMNQATMLSHKKEVVYRILNIAIDEEKEKSQQVIFSSLQKLDKEIELVLVRKNLLTILMESIKGG